MVSRTDKVVRLWECKLGNSLDMTYAWRWIHNKVSNKSRGSVDVDVTGLPVPLVQNVVQEEGR